MMLGSEPVRLTAAGVESPAILQELRGRRALVVGGEQQAFGARVELCGEGYRLAGVVRGLFACELRAGVVRGCVVRVDGVKDGRGRPAVLS